MGWHRGRWLWLSLGLVVGGFLLRGLLLVGYQRERSAAYAWGAFHVHSTMSDGLSDLDTITRQAAEADVSYLLMSEHGMPHREASLLRESIHGVEVIGGSEVGLPEGHLIMVAPSEVRPYKLPPHPPEAFAEIEEWGGFSVLTYPDDPQQGWSYWEEDLQPDGMELINITSRFRAGTFFDRLRWAAFTPFNRWYYLSSLQSPAEALKRWDEMLVRGKVFGFYAANAHGGFRVAGTIPIPIPSYTTAFGFAGLGMTKDEAADPEAAIRSGNFFMLLRAAGEPQTFAFEATRAEESWPPGSRVERGVTLRAQVETLALRPWVVLTRGGQAVATSTDVLEQVAEQDGVYRVEVYLRDHPLLPRDVPWILSNPIFVGGEEASRSDSDSDSDSNSNPLAACGHEELIDLTRLALEKDPDSRGNLRVTETGEAELVYQLSQATAEEVNRWVALALRQPLELETATAMLIEARASEPMRYWLELRAGERAFYASFKVTPEKRRLLLPWNRFFAMFGERTPVPDREIDSLFVTVNTSNSHTGFGSALTLSKLGWCR